MDLSREELVLIQNGLNKRIWSFNHVGLPNSDSRVTPYVTLLARITAELKKGI
jgi:hypothetical protein